MLSLQFEHFCAVRICFVICKRNLNLKGKSENCDASAISTHFLERKYLHNFFSLWRLELDTSEHVFYFKSIVLKILIIIVGIKNCLFLHNKSMLLKCLYLNTCRDTFLNLKFFVWITQNFNNNVCMWIIFFFYYLWF